jgi:hypothetical protein
MNSMRFLGALAVAALVVAAAAAIESEPKAQGPTRPRPGLTAQQTKEAIRLTKTAMTELRKKTEGATEKGADVREYIVGVERLLSPADESSPEKDASSAGDNAPDKTKPAPEKKDDEKAKPADKEPGPLAVVTWYRYFDDITVFATVDLGKAKIVSVEAVQHLRTPLSADEFEEAQELAREKSDEVKQLYERFGKDLSAYPQFSQYTLEDDPRVNRVVHVTYRVGKRDLSYPRPEVNLTTRKVEVPRPDADNENENEPAPKTKPRRPTE